MKFKVDAKPATLVKYLRSSMEALLLEKIMVCLNIYFSTLLWFIDTFSQTHALQLSLNKTRTHQWMLLRAPKAEL